MEHFKAVNDKLIKPKKLKAFTLYWFSYQL